MKHFCAIVSTEYDRSWRLSSLGMWHSVVLSQKMVFIVILTKCVLLPQSCRWWCTICFIVHTKFD